jgi:hypothetical protein
MTWSARTLSSLEAVWYRGYFYDMASRLKTDATVCKELISRGRKTLLAELYSLEI